VVVDYRVYQQIAFIVVLFVQLENPAVLRSLHQQPMTESQRQTVADLLERALPESPDAAFNPSLLARYEHLVFITTVTTTTTITTTTATIKTTTTK